MIELPETDEEFTQFALEQAGQLHGLYPQRRPLSERKQIRDWTYRVCRNRPDLVQLEHVQHPVQRDCTRLYIAGVWITTASGHVGIDRFLFLCSPA